MYRFRNNLNIFLDIFRSSKIKFAPTTNSQKVILPIMSHKFLLCFHDFSVWNYQTIMPILEEMKDFVGAPFSVLVIPDTEKASVKDIAGFKAALSQLQADGFELALHGYKHKAEFSQGRSYLGLAAMSITSREAEFAGLSEYESSRMLQQSLTAWRQLHDNEKTTPVAFVPPTWWSNSFLHLQVRNEKMLYEDRFSLTTKNGKRYASPVASFAGIPDIAINLMFNIGELTMKFPAGIPRIALHPTDFPKFRSRIKRLIRAALGSGRELAQYKDL